jgi:hypothetical protein
VGKEDCRRQSKTHHDASDEKTDELVLFLFCDPRFFSLICELEMLTGLGTVSQKHSSLPSLVLY